MLVQEIKIKNFRQFVNEEITFSTDKYRNITVIHGENGSGKTTLLQAFNWCFYGGAEIFSDSKELMLNKVIADDLRKGESACICVELKFLHNNIEHWIIRHQPVERVVGKLKYSKATLKIKQKKANGSWGYYERDPQNYIDSIFPRSLSSYFLFDGERIRNLGDNNRLGKKDIRSAVATILNLDNLANSTKHLKEVRNKIRDEYSKDFQNSNNKNIIQLIEEKEKDVEVKQECLNNLENNRDQYKEEVERLTQSMKSFHEIKDKEKQRQNLAKDIEREKLAIEKSYSKFMKLYSDMSFSLLAKRLFDASRRYLSEFKLEDGIVEGIDGKAIDQLLKRKVCLCGEKITEGCDIEKALLKLKEYVPPQSYGVMVNNFIKDINRMERKSNNLGNILTNDYKEYLNHIKVLDDKNNQLLEIEDFMKNHSLDAVKNTQQKREAAQKKYEQSLTSIGTTKRIIEELNKQLTKLKDDKEMIAINNEKDELVRKKEVVVEQLISYFDDFYKNQETEVKNHLQQLVGKIFNQILHKNYNIKFDDKYNFFVYDMNGKEVPMSEGEKQITSLSFITGIVDMAKDKELNKRFAEKTNYDSTEIYPVIMDSPFGSLDNIHRKNVAEKVPELSGQTILFASSSQWEGEVEKAMSEKVGSAYRMIFGEENTKDHKAECTKICEVTNYV